MESRFAAYHRRKREYIKELEEKVKQLETRIIELEAVLRYEQERRHTFPKRNRLMT